MIDWVKANRLKVASVAAVSGDIFMGLAGGIGLFNISFENPSYAAMTLGGLIGVIGHAALLTWGKGAKTADGQTHSIQKPLSIFLKPLIPWRYPLDSAFGLFVVANILYLAAGLYLGNYPLAISGLMAAIASAFGWLWPQEKLVFGMRSMQLTALLYGTATLNHFGAAFWSMNPMIFLSACCFLTCNVIFFTVRKENQSTFTQTHET